MKLAIIAGDGIGPEVVGEAVKVLDAVHPGIQKTSYDLGARRYHATKEVLPDSVLDELRSHDAILLGAIGDPSVPSGVLERGLLLKIRFALDHHINLRPARLYAGVSSPLAAAVCFMGSSGRFCALCGSLAAFAIIASEVRAASAIRGLIIEASGRFLQYFLGISACIAFTLSRAGLKIAA